MRTKARETVEDETKLLDELDASRRAVVLEMDDVAAAIEELRERYGVSVEEIERHVPGFMGWGRVTRGALLVAEARLAQQKLA